ncbi:hypothetical protein PSEUDO8O_170599 [Pseudomonas sp. 8O]|nr:hypothetical protein PSEUDO8O_170599 [Pseudomonas sp. 8O]
MRTDMKPSIFCHATNRLLALNNHCRNPNQTNQIAHSILNKKINHMQPKLGNIDTHRKLSRNHHTCKHCHFNNSFHYIDIS